MFEYIKILLKGLFSGNKVSCVFKSDSKINTVSKISQNEKLVELILELQFSSNDSNYIAFSLARAFEKEGVILELKEMNFFKSLVQAIERQDKAFPMMNAEDVDALVGYYYSLSVTDNYVTTLYKSCYVDSACCSMPEVMTTAGFNWGEPSSENESKSIEPEKIKELADNLGLVEQELSLDELLANTSKALK